MSLKTKCATLAVAILFAQPVFAVVVIQPIAITANALATSRGNMTNLINQTGLSSRYTSGVTDYAAYLAEKPTHANPSISNGWISGSGTTTGDIDFDLGGEFSLENFALWNGDGGWGMDSFTLFIDNDASFSTAINVGTWSAAQVPAPSPLESFDFEQTPGTHVRLQVNSHHNNTPYIVLSEVAFGGTMAKTVVPEPASAALLGLALVAIGFRRNRVR